MTSLERPDDEIANVITHGVGFFASLLAAGLLIHRASGQSAAVIAACALYSVTLVLVYAASTLSHLFYELALRRRFRTIDQACIFLLIAGTYTPLAVMYVNHGFWRVVLILMWIFALGGAIRVIRVGDLSRTDKYFYGVLGFLPVVTLAELFHRAPKTVVIWTIAGGAFYSLGGPFLRWSALFRYSHAIWHLFVVAGSASHYWAILQAVTLLGSI